MTRVSILAFDLFPWRQSRMKLAKTLQMGQTPWWVKWTHLDACTQICRNRPEVPSFRLNWPANGSSNQNKKHPRWLWGSCTAPSLCIACLCVHSMSLTETQSRFSLVSCDTDSITIHVITHYQPTNWLPWNGLAFGRVGLVCFTLCFSFLIKPLAEHRGMSDLMRRLWCFGTFTDCKNATQQEKERLWQMFVALCACAVQSFPAWMTGLGLVSLNSKDCQVVRQIQND